MAHADPHSAPGFLEGQLKVETSRGAYLADENATKTEPVYDNYPLVVLSKHGGTEVAQIKADKHGHYRVALPPGDYTLELKGSRRHRLPDARPAFKIVSGETAHVDMEIGPDIGVM